MVSLPAQNYHVDSAYYQKAEVKGFQNLHHDLVVNIPPGTGTNNGQSETFPIQVGSNGGILSYSYSLRSDISYWALELVMLDQNKNVIGISFALGNIKSKDRSLYPNNAVGTSLLMPGTAYIRLDAFMYAYNPTVILSLGNLITLDK